MWPLIISPSTSTIAFHHRVTQVREPSLVPVPTASAIYGIETRLAVLKWTASIWTTMGTDFSFTLMTLVTAAVTKPAIPTVLAAATHAQTSVGTIIPRIRAANSSTTTSTCGHAFGTV
jgi:hypothetical protein